MSTDLRIKIACSTGETLDVHVLPSDTIRTLKEHVAAHANIPVWEQKWTFGARELGDGERIAESGIPQGATVGVLKKRSASMVFDFVPQSKEALCKAIGGLRAEGRRLRKIREFSAFLSRDYFDDYDRALASICFQPARPLRSIPIDVIVDEKTPPFRLLIKPTDSVRDVKMRLLPLVGGDCELWMGEVELNDAEAIEVLQLGEKSVLHSLPRPPLPDRSVQPEDTLHGLYEELHSVQKEVREALPLPPNGLSKWHSEVNGLIGCFRYVPDAPRFVVYVRVPTGKTVIVAGVFGPCTMQKIKAVVEQTEGIPASDQRLFYGGKELKDEWTLAGARIPNEATLHSVGFISGADLLQQLPRLSAGSRSLSGCSDFRLLARQMEREFGGLKRRVDALRQLVEMNGRQEDTRTAIIAEYSNIEEGRKKKEAPKVDARLINEWRQAVSKLGEESKREQKKMDHLNAQITKRKREAEELRRLLERRQPTQ